MENQTPATQHTIPPDKADQLQAAETGARALLSLWWVLMFLIFGLKKAGKKRGRGHKFD